MLKKAQNKIRKTSVKKTSAGRRHVAWPLLLIALPVAFLVLILSVFGIMSFKTAAAELAIPDDYGIGYEDKLNNLTEGDGIEAVSGNTYRIKYGSGENGFVTLARISHTNTLEGYTFLYEVGGLVNLGVNYVDGKAVSDGSFFGFGNQDVPFKGKLVIGGANDTAIAMGADSWRYLFNNISNEASITVSSSAAEGRCMFSSYINDENKQESDLTDEEKNTFVFAKTLTVTSDTEMNISGFRFGAAKGSRNEGAVVIGTGKMALFAGEVKAGTGTSFSVDLSKSLTDGKYVVKSSNGEAGGIFGSIEAGVNVTVNLPASFRCEATSNGTQTNAGILVGSNNGTVSFKTTEADGTMLFNGTVVATGSAGLIGANQDGSQATFANSFCLTVNASGIRAGGIAGTLKGQICIQSAEITNSVFQNVTSATAGRLGGAVGSVDRLNNSIIVADGESVILSGNTFTATGGCYVGGYIGYLKTAGADIAGVTIENTTINGTGNSSNRIGGYIGTIETEKNSSDPTNVRITVDGTPAQFNFTGISAGVCGGIVGDVNAILSDKLEIVGTPGGSISSVIGNETGATVGGIIGKVTGYVRVDGLSMNNTIARSTYAGDVAGSVDDGAMLEIGKVTVNESKESQLVARTGIGSVLRLNGAIDNRSSTVLGIVYEQNYSLIYRDTGCTYTEGKTSINNDIGNYGQVFRNDTLGVLSFDENKHKVSVSAQLNASGNTVSVADAADLMKLAVTFYTNGAISGVTGADCAALYGKDFSIDGNISLANTGIEQLTPANKDTAFTGSILGNGHTVTLAIGQNINGDYPGVFTCKIVKENLNNARKYMGLFSAVKGKSGASVSQLTINGKIITDLLATGEQYVGYLAGLVSGGELSLSACQMGAATKDSEITVRGTDTDKPTLFIGGVAGRVNGASKISAVGCTLLASISDNSTDSGRTYYCGGFCGNVKYSGSGKIDFTNNNTISTKFSKTASSNEHRVGGLIGQLVCDKYKEVDLSGTNSENVHITVSGKSGGSVGGILGHTFQNCHLLIDGSFAGSVSAGSANLGGLIHTLAGRLDVKAGADFNGLTLIASGNTRGVLVANGKAALITIAAAPSDFNGITADGFDLFVGENIESYTSVDVAASGGIVTVETGDDIGKFPEASDWYALINARQNTKTRYYFNIANITPTSGTVASAQDLIYWQVYGYANGINAGAKAQLLPTAVNNITASIDIDATGYCLYPSVKKSVSVNFEGHRLTFGRPSGVASANQFYGLQAGLFSDLTAPEADSTVKIQNIVLDGTVSYLMYNGTGKASGALICGTVYGNQPNANRFTVNLTVSGVTLDGVKIEGTNDYRPLLINVIDSFVRTEISGIREGANKQPGAGSSLLGYGGIVRNSEPSSYVTVIFRDIKLEGKKETSEFTKATLFYDISYVSGTGSIYYNFEFAEDWGSGEPHNVTYGAELTLDDEQKTYFDNEFFVHPTVKPSDGSAEFDFSVDYLPYVYLHADGVTTNRSLRVNRKSTDFTEGWGTYENPYIITSGKQLYDLCNWLSGNSVFNDGWSINFPKGTWNELKNLDLTGCYTVVASGNKLSCTVNDETKTLDATLLLKYLSGAYFKFADDRSFTLASGYPGIGSETYPFHGVIHGNGGSVTLPDTMATNSGYGFIRVANGCAVYMLSVNYGKISASTNEMTTNGTATTGPNNSGAVTTQIPHFGGVIARIIGGDNLIQNVGVNYDSIGNAACHAAIGGYVGLISGGGVLFDSLEPISGIYVQDNTLKNLYRNNYVGRVLNGYALAIDGATYENTANEGGKHLRGDYIIPSLANGTFASHKTGYSGNTFTISTAEELLMFSLAINSGALSGNNGDAYGSTSISRNGDYSHVGTEWTGVYADGRYADDTKKVSVLAEYFGINTATDLRNTPLTVNLSDVTYDMTDYGNAFRAIGGAYGNSTTYKITSFGAANGATLKLDMDMLYYAKQTGTKKFCDDESDRIVSYGIFGKVNGAVSFKNITLEGMVSVRRVVSYDGINSNGDIALTGVALYNGSYSLTVGGLLGTSGGAVTLTNISSTANGLSVISPDIAGGLVGYHSTGDFTLTNNEGCSIQNLTVKGKRSVGGAVAHVASGTVSIQGLHVRNAIIESKLHNSDASDKSGISIGAGGFIGFAGSSSTVQVENSSTEKTAVVIYANYKTTGDKSVGGLIGLANDNVKKISFLNCTVDGGVVFSLSNYSGSKYPYETAASANTGIFSSDFINALVYNGEEQSSAKILAYLLSQKASGSNYAASAVGGFVGGGKTNFEFTNCTITSSAAPVILASHDNAGGFIGDQRSETELKVTNCSITTGGHDIYVMGDTRTGGIIGYRATTPNAPSYTIDGFHVVGSPEHPLRLITYEYYSTGDAAGLFGDVSKITLTASNIEVKYCIMGGTRAAGVFSSAKTSGSTLKFTNVHVENNLLYSISNYNVGGVFSDTSNVNITLDGVYVANNRLVSAKSAGGISGLMSSGTLYTKYLIMDGNILQNSYGNKKVENFTFAAKPLADDQAIKALLTNPDKMNYSGVGQFIGNNSATVTLIAVSFSDPEGVKTAKWAGNSGGSSTITAVYAAHGAAAKYVEAGGYGVIVDKKTPQERAILMIAENAMIDGTEESLVGNSAVGEIPNAINELWTYYGKTGGYGNGGSGGTFSADTHKPLGDEIAYLTHNEALRIFCLTGNTDKTMKEYLNMLTGNGFSSALGNGLIGIITSQRYTVEPDGNLIPVTKDAQPVGGSVVFDGTNFKAAGTYDNLEGDTKTLSIITVPFKGPDGSVVYSMDIVIYYHRSVNLKTYVVPLEGEQYYLPQFIVPEPIGNSFSSSITFGSPFTLYIEYNYNDKAMALEQLSNFNKAIELTNVIGQSDENAKIEAGTSLVLIDLNSLTPSGYSYYVKDLTSDSRFINFNDFVNGEQGFTHVNLTKLELIGKNLDNRVCRDSGIGDNNDCIYTEKYLLVVFPVQKVTDVAMAYNMKAVIDEEQRKDTNITVIRKREVLATVSVWGTPTMDNSGTYTDHENKQFSNLSDEPMQMKVTSTVEFPSGYIGALSGQTGAAVYENHILQLIDNTSKPFVTLPRGTKITVTSIDGNTKIYESTLTSPASNVRFSVGNILDDTLKSTNKHTTEYIVSLDFSQVTGSDFGLSFSGVETIYTLKDYMYISGSPDIDSIQCERAAEADFTAKIDTSIKLAIVPEDNRHLGINLKDPSDVTNNGVIAFSVNALFDSISGKTYENATFTFSIEKKEYDSVNEKYTYVPLTDDEAAIFSMYKYDGVSEITSDTVTVEKVDSEQEAHGKYKLVVDLNNPLLHAENSDLITNYKLKVTIKATSTDGQQVVVDDYFVFLICDLTVEK